jgi:hypothetical protein
MWGCLLQPHALISHSHSTCLAEHYSSNFFEADPQAVEGRVQAHQQKESKGPVPEVLQDMCEDLCEHGKLEPMQI